MKTIGLALGGGGAKGMAHIPMLEVFDELGIRPHRIAGTSVGAIIGVLYAAGMTGRQIRKRVQSMMGTKGETLRQALKRKEALKWIGLMDLDFKGQALFKGDKLIEFLYKLMGAATFEELKIPMRVVATDFWTSEQVVLDSGKLLPAVKASMALPGIFVPVTLKGRVLVDGGGVNPLPHDLLGDCDIVVAVNVIGNMTGNSQKVPSLYRAITGMFDIMQKSIIAEKLKKQPPDIYIKPDVIDVDALEFFKADEMFTRAAPAQKKLKQELTRLLRDDRH